jgi:tetratricopeptide (TPR) repeat protein
MSERTDLSAVTTVRTARCGLAAAFICLAVYASGPDAATAASQILLAQAPTEKPAETPEELAKREAELLASLFERLANAQSEEDAELLESAVWQIWLRSGSDTIDVLMQQTIKAMNDERMDAALAILDSIVELQPDYAEGWNKRATVLYIRQQYDASLRDIAKVLELEPRHFGALSGLGLINRAQGNGKAALDAYRRALAIHPFLAGVAQSIRELEIEVEGQAL